MRTSSSSARPFVSPARCARVTCRPRPLTRCSRTSRPGSATGRNGSASRRTVVRPVHIERETTMKKLITIAAALVALVVAGGASAAHRDAPSGAVYALTNAAAGNDVGYFANGSLVGAVATGGLGTGSNLGSQGAVTVSDDLLFAVNAGSDSISEFQVKKDNLKLLRVFSSNGVRPISVTVHDGVLYALNAGSSQITGFALEGKGNVKPIAGSTQPLLGSGPAQVAFSRDGPMFLENARARRTL